MAKTDLDKLTPYQYMAIMQNADVFRRFTVEHGKSEVNVYCEMNIFNPRKVECMIAVLDCYTNDPVEYDEETILFLVEGQLFEKDPWKNECWEEAA
ncbi:hypothetical protein KKC32_00495 [Patescibacteria group bacterium]|nr:hypothetical protein [Patescibacteria group bacterium]